MSDQQGGPRNMLQCADHGYAPGGVICVHLMNGACREWLRASPDLGPDGEDDWLCRGCAENVETVAVDDLAAVCIHCIRTLRRRYDPKFTE
jgi:hypothetical protein